MHAARLFKPIILSCTRESQPKDFGASPELGIGGSKVSGLALNEKHTTFIGAGLAKVSTHYEG